MVCQVYVGLLLLSAQNSKDMSNLNFTSQLSQGFSDMLTIKKTLGIAAAKLVQSCPTVRPHRRQPTRLPRPWDSPGKNTGVGCHFLLLIYCYIFPKIVHPNSSTILRLIHTNLPLWYRTNNAL